MIAAAAFALAASAAATDDPGMALRSAAKPEPETYSFARKDGPSFKLAFQRFVLPDQADSELEMMLGSMETYFYSRYVRVGMGLRGGVGSPRSDILVGGGLTLGLQWPAGVTPFVEFGFGGGLYYRTMLAGQLFWMHQFAVDAGIEIFLIGDFYLSAAFGWMRPVIHGAVAGEDLYYDVVAMKFGLGF